MRCETCNRYAHGDPLDRNVVNRHTGESIALREYMRRAAKQDPLQRGSMRDHWTFANDDEESQCSSS